MTPEPTRETFETMDLSTVCERGHFFKISENSKQGESSMTAEHAVENSRNY